jgi:nucleoid-associated protein Lsr2
MAQRTILQLTDDLDGKPIRDGKGETIRFSLDRIDYEIDLADKNAKALRATFAKYVSAGRRTGAGTRRGRGAARRAGTGPARDGRGYDPAAVRAWAEAQGLQVSQRGRIPVDLVAQFQAANS